jgi:hypothetical protein
MPDVHRPPAQDAVKNVTRSSIQQEASQLLLRRVIEMGESKGDQMHALVCERA